MARILMSNPMGKRKVVRDHTAITVHATVSGIGQMASFLLELTTGKNLIVDLSREDVEKLSAVILRP